MSGFVRRTGKYVEVSKPWINGSRITTTLTFYDDDLAERFHAALDGDQIEQSALQIAAENLVCVFDDPGSGESSGMLLWAVDNVREVLTWIDDRSNA